MSGTPAASCRAPRRNTSGCIARYCTVASMAKTARITFVSPRRSDETRLSDLAG
ncbi:hypothetical protein F8568_012215 [Actinomadura sp. LD22]|uniref:Uncharacterized protein n=1 Tax=Actinomadura physcomitrii TaxID=2650748 RepID=A0A6I4M7Z7_9ACTN|nr:hypothetical protein [Actinomadura physcomitrii]MWA01130.1 hypothetical protein [Actinomadura physcomitrii]